MRVLTLTPVDVYLLLLNSAPEPVLLRRDTPYRGDLLLACSKMNARDVDRYTDLYIPTGLMTHPVKWATDFAYASSVFSEAVLEDVTAADDKRFAYHLNLKCIFDPPLHVDKMRPFWWYYDLETQSVLDRFPPDDSTIRAFYALCEALERGEAPQDDDPALYLLDADPRARALRRGILARLHGHWVVVKRPNWRAVFGKKFGKQFVPKLKQGQNYDSGHWKEVNHESSSD